MRIAVMAGTCLVLHIHPVVAQLPITTAPETVVTATRLPQEREQSVRPVTVITAEQIAQSGQQTLVEVLQALGGVEIASNGGPGQPSSVFMRGANSSHTLVLVDGLRLNSATTGTTAFEHIPVNQIAKIEIVPGPSSGLYGSEAIGGVIQIFTKSGQGAAGQYLSAGAGGYRTRTVQGGISRSFGGTDFSVNAGYNYTGGFDATKPSIPFGQNNPDRDSYENSNLSARIAQRFGADHELGVTMFRSEGRAHFDNGPTTDDLSRQRLSAYSIYSRNRIMPRWESLLSIGEGRDELSVRGAVPGSFDTRQPQFTWQNNVAIGPGSAVAGVEYLEQKIDSTAAYTVTSRTIRSAFGGYTGEYGRHAWQINGRRDDNSQFGNHDTGNAGYALRIIPDLRLRVGVGTAFKAPTFNDLYFPGFGNPTLRPERSRNREAGVDYRYGTQRFVATHFQNRIEDLIVFDLATFLPQNLQRARIEGTELAYEGRWNPFYLTARATFQRPINEMNGKLLPRRAREHGSIATGYAVGPWTIGAEVIASGERFDSTTEAPATRMHGYGLLNLTASYAFNREWLVRARWNNVTDTQYELAKDFNTPGSNVFLTLQYQSK